MNLMRRTIIAAVLALSLLSPAAALASGGAVVSDCATDGKLDRKYSPGDYADALKHIPTDVDEYTDCRDIIRRGQLGLSGGSSSSSSSGGVPGTAGGGGTPGGTGGDAGAAGGTAAGNGLNAYDNAIASATPEQRASVDKLVKGTPTAVQIAGQQLRPDSLGHGDLGSLNSLPTPLVLVLLLLGVGALAAAASPVKALVLTRLQRSA
ncbi:MAG: hypothetical protein JWM31_764 [Solirubrobacterales bacterium]|nr:hypothetical protein [Solirubrobacterales bacterium]